MPLPKKRDLTNCTKWHGITLVPGSSFSILLSSIGIKGAINRQLQKQAGFVRHERSCNDQMFVLQTATNSEITAWQWQISTTIKFKHFKNAFDSLIVCIISELE